MMAPVESPPAATHAERRAAGNWTSNLRALSQTQPRVAEQMQAMPTDVEWLFARDGYLTSRDDGQWWAGCSVPLRAAQYMMRTLDVSSTTACILNPAHAAQVRAVLDLLQPQQGLIVLQPIIESLQMLVCCDDFSAEFERHRLWMARGQNWEDELRRIFEENCGLPTPSQFVRPVAADYSEADSLVAPAQRIFAEVNERRASRVAQIICERKAANSTKICVIAPSRFRLWDGAGAMLGRLLLASDAKIEQFDPDDPASASPLALAQIAADCGAIVAANTARSDLPEVAHRQMPWVTWLTTPRIPAAGSRGENDALLVTDEVWRKIAIDAGWPQEKVSVANWPISVEPEYHGQEYLPVPPAEEAPVCVAIVSDLLSLEPPKQVAEYSSHALLWDAVADELLKDPFTLGNVNAFLDERMRQLQITADRFDRALFIERLIVPAYQQGLAQLLIRQQIPLRCHGRGWDQIESLSQYATGPIETHDEFAAAINASRSLIHCWPVGHSHPSEACGRPVVRAFGRTREQFLRDVKLAVEGALAPPPRRVPTLSAEAILRSIRLH